MQPVNRLGMLVLVLVTVAACGPAPPPPQAAPPAPAVDVAAEEKAVRAVSASWLKFEGERNAAGIAGLFADDGRLIWVGQDPVVGPAAIQAFMTKEWDANPKRTSTWTIERVIVATGGDIALEYGNYTNTATGKDGKGTDRGSYVTVHQKIGETWKVKSDASASSMPVAPAGS